MPRPPDPRRETLRKFAQRHSAKPSYNGTPYKGGPVKTTANDINTPEGYETRDKLPAGQKIPSSAAGRRLQRKNAGVSDVRNATPEQIRRLRRLGLL